MGNMIVAERLPGVLWSRPLSWNSKAKLLMAPKDYSNMYSIRYTNTAGLFLHIYVAPFFHGLFSLEFLIAFSFFLGGQRSQTDAIFTISCTSVFFSFWLTLSLFILFLVLEAWRAPIVAGTVIIWTILFWYPSSPHHCSGRFSFALTFCY